MDRIRMSLVIAVLLCLPFSAAPAGARSPSAALDGGIPPQWRAVPSGLELLAAAREPGLDAAAFEDIRRGLLRAEARTAALAEPEFVYPYRAGDLDGDGKNDVLTFEFIGEDPTLRARSGLDGTELWNDAGAYLAIPADMDGDADGQLVTLSAERTNLADGVDAVAQRVSLLDGDGSALWTYEVPGAVVRLNDMEGGVASDLEAVVSVRVIPDATGDGLQDVWVGTLSFVYVHVDQINVLEVFSGRTVDGATGRDAGRVVAAGLNALPWAIPVADLSGDGLADTVSIGGLLPDGGLLAARSTTGAPHWVAEVPTNFAYLTTHELTGDGAPDAILQAFVDGGVQRLGFDGASGAAIFARPDAGYTDAAGDIDGDGGTDMIQVEPVNASIVATAWSGSSGEDIWGPVTYAGPEGAFVAFCSCTDDLDGDGVWDPLTAEVVFGEPPQVNVRTLNGADGSELWALNASPSDSFPIPLGVDADGDGVTDLGVGSADGATVTLTVRRGADFTPVWATGGAMEGFPLGFYGDDVAGDGEPELVLASVRFVEEWFAGSAHAFGRSGRLWTVP